MKLVLLICWPALAVYFFLRREQLDQEYIVMGLFGSVIIVLTIIFLISLLTLAIFDLSNIIVIVTRILIAFTMVNMMENEHPLFQGYDPKSMSGSISFVAIPVILCTTINWRIDLLLTAPIMVVSELLMFQRAFTPANDNIMCFLGIDTYMRGLQFRTLFFMLVIVWSAHQNYKAQFSHFISQELATQQQKCL